MLNRSLEIFKRLSLKEETKVEKYVYHLTGKHTREGIKKNGLVAEKKWYYKAEKYPVYAHNTHRFSEDWYWYCLDLYQYGSSYFDPYISHLLNERDETRFFVNHYYDIWRIDTEMVNKEWFIDFCGLKENSHVKENYYVKCFNNIPVEALTLCTLDIDLAEEINIKDNIEHIYYNPIISRDEFILKHRFTPEEEIYIDINNPNYFETIEGDEIGIFNHWKSLNRSKFRLKTAA